MNIPTTHLVKGHMKHKLLLLLLAFPCLLLSACTTADLHYHALRDRPSGNWQGSSSQWGGYTETKQSNGNYKIGFESYNLPSAAATAHFTLVRAAERAAIDGQKTFYLEESPVKTSRQRSHFPGYVIPGYCETRTIIYEEVDDCGHVHHVKRQITTHQPDTYVPPRDVVNSIHKSMRKLSYRKTLSKPYDTYTILSNASRNTSGFGRPKLDPRAHTQMKAWLK